MRNSSVDASTFEVVRCAAFWSSVAQCLVKAVYKVLCHQALYLLQVAVDRSSASGGNVMHKQALAVGHGAVRVHCTDGSVRHVAQCSFLDRDTACSQHAASSTPCSMKLTKLTCIQAATAARLRRTCVSTQGH